MISDRFLCGTRICLRALEPSDLEFLYSVENDTSQWGTCETLVPFSRYNLKNYLENTGIDPYKVGQLRLVIHLNTDTSPIGMIELFDINAKNSRAGMGVVFLENKRSMGLGTEAIKLMVEYAFLHLRLNQIYVDIKETNTAALKVFKKLGFKVSGVKKQWYASEEGFLNSVFLQKTKDC